MNAAQTIDDEGQGVAMTFLATTHYEIYVPRNVMGTRTHVLVKLTLLHDRTDIPFSKTAFLAHASSLLSGWQCLPDKVEVLLSMTDILLFLIQMQAPSAFGHD